MEIDLINAKKEFLKYTENYDLENINIKRKQLHSLRVMEISKNIAENIKLSDEEIKIATLIGLLHDIARFEQYTNYHTFSDLNSIDHGDFGAQILEDDLRKYIRMDKYDNIIKTAIKNHNKYQIEEGITDKEKLFSKIIRDADKIDILYEVFTEFYKGREEELEEDIITENDIKEFKELKSIIRTKEQKNELYNVISMISFIFDINLKVSFKILKEEDSINKILNQFQFKDEKTKRLIGEIRNIANSYIEEKVNN